jgi:hypothetical protein
MQNYLHNESIDLIFCDPLCNFGENFDGRKDLWVSSGLALFVVGLMHGEAEGFPRFSTLGAFIFSQ